MAQRQNQAIQRQYKIADGWAAVEQCQPLSGFDVQEGVITLPKSTNPERIAGNLDVFDFELTEAEMEEMRSLDTDKGAHGPDAPGVAEMLLNAHKIED